MLHELTHALTAYALQVPCTFYPIVVLVLLPMPVALARGPHSRIVVLDLCRCRDDGQSKAFRRKQRNLHLGWADIALLLLVTLVVRLTTRGITFAA